MLLLLSFFFFFSFFSFAFLRAVKLPHLVDQRHVGRGHASGDHALRAEARASSDVGHQQLCRVDLLCEPRGRLETGGLQGCLAHGHGPVARVDDLVVDDLEFGGLEREREREREKGEKWN